MERYCIVNKVLMDLPFIFKVVIDGLTFGRVKLQVILSVVCHWNPVIKQLNKP